MARAPKTTKTSDSTALVNWDEQLAAQAQVAAGMEASSGGGQFFSTKSGQLSFGGNPMPGNQMAVVILDHIFETTYYEGDYDPENPSPPTAFALGRVENELRWHETSAEGFAGELCKDSDVCQWGSADKGRGKAAKETRRLAMISAGTFNQQGKFEPHSDPDHFASAEPAYMKLPVMSVKGWATFVKQIAEVMRRPPHGIFTKVSVVPDAKSQFRVLFEPLAAISNDLLPIIMKKHEAVKSVIEFPYNMEAPEPPAKPARGRAAPPARGAAKAPARKGKY